MLKTAHSAWLDPYVQQGTRADRREGFTSLARARPINSGSGRMKAAAHRSVRPLRYRAKSSASSSYSLDLSPRAGSVFHLLRSHPPSQHLSRSKCGPEQRSSSSPQDTVPEPPLLETYRQLFPESRVGQQPAALLLIPPALLLCFVTSACVVGVTERGIVDCPGSVHPWLLSPSRPLVSRWLFSTVTHHHHFNTLPPECWPILPATLDIAHNVSNLQCECIATFDFYFP